jgi:hypothetical protein
MLNIRLTFLASILDNLISGLQYVLWPFIWSLVVNVAGELE